MREVTITLRMKEVRSNYSKERLSSLIESINEKRRDFESELERYDNIRILFAETEAELMKYLEERFDFLGITIYRFVNFSFIGFLSDDEQRTFGFKLHKNEYSMTNKTFGKRYEKIDDRLSIEIVSGRFNSEYSIEKITFETLDKILDAKHNDVIEEILINDFGH